MGLITAIRCSITIACLGPTPKAGWIQVLQLRSCIKECKEIHPPSKCCGSAKYFPAKGECCYDATRSIVGTLKPRWEVLGHDSWKACVWDIAGFAQENLAALGLTAAGGYAAKKAQFMMIAHKFPPTLAASILGWIGRAAIAERTCRREICSP